MDSVPVGGAGRLVTTAQPWSKPEAGITTHPLRHHPPDHNFDPSYLAPEPTSAGGLRSLEGEGFGTSSSSETGWLPPT